MVSDSKSALAAKPRKLLVLSSTYPRWADDSEPSFVHELSRRMTGAFKVTVLCPSSKGSLSFEKMNNVDVIRYRYAPKPWETLVHQGGIVNNIRSKPWKVFLLPTFIVSQLITALWLCVRDRPDVIHAHWLIPQGLIAAIISACFSGKIPFVVTSHGTDLWSFKSGLFKKMKTWVTRRASVVAVVSRAMAYHLEEQVGHVKHVVVAPMGVDLEARFKPKPSQNNPASQIICVGRLIESKGVEYLIRAIPLLTNVFPDLRVVIVGDGPDKARLCDIARGLGVLSSCEFKGKVSHTELPSLFHSSSVFVAPFLQEGLGLVCIEALGSGCPVVVSDIPAIRDITESAGRIHRVPVRDHEAIASAVCHILANLEAELKAARESHQGLSARFSWERVSGDYIDILKQASRLCETE